MRALPDERKAASTDAQWTQLIAEYPALVRRPVTVTPDGEVTVGFSESATANASPDRAAPWPAGNSIGQRRGSPMCFDRDARELARDLLGKVIRHRVDGLWLSARIIETEAYYQAEGQPRLAGLHPQAARAVHGRRRHLHVLRARRRFAELQRRRAGNAVLIKSGHPWVDARSGPEALARMQALNPDAAGRARPPHKLCAGQTLLCRALGLKVPDWDARRFDPEALYVEDVGERPAALIRCARLGIPAGRDEHLPYRYVDPAYAAFCTRNPLRRGRSRVATTSGWMGGAGNCHRRAGRSGRSPVQRARRRLSQGTAESAVSGGAVCGYARPALHRASISAYFRRTRRRFRRRLQAYSGIRGSEPKPSIRYSPGLPSALRPQAMLEGETSCSTTWASARSSKNSSSRARRPRPAGPGAPGSPPWARSRPRRR